MADLDPKRTLRSLFANWLATRTEPGAITRAGQGGASAVRNGALLFRDCREPRLVQDRPDPQGSPTLSRLFYRLTLSFTPQSLPGSLHRLYRRFVRVCLTAPLISLALIDRSHQPSDFLLHTAKLLEECPRPREQFGSLRCELKRTISSVEQSD